MMKASFLAQEVSRGSARCITTPGSRVRWLSWSRCGLSASYFLSAPPLSPRGPTGRMSGRERVKAAFAEPEIITKKGKAVTVILAIKQYQEILERPEDAEDVAWLKKA